MVHLKHHSLLTKTQMHSRYKTSVNKTSSCATANQAGSLKCCVISSPRRNISTASFLQFFIVCERTQNFYGIMLSSSIINEYTDV